MGVRDRDERRLGTQEADSGAMPLHSSKYDSRLELAFVQIDASAG